VASLHSLFSQFERGFHHNLLLHGRLVKVAQPDEASGRENAGEYLGTELEAGPGPDFFTESQTEWMVTIGLRPTWNRKSLGQG
jgi:hypothetical protein